MALLVDGRSLQTPSQLRGIGRYTLALLRCLKGRSRCRFLFFDPPPEEFSSQALLYPGPRRMISWLDNLFLAPLFRRFGITLYHSPAYALPGRIRGCRSLLTLHDLTPLHFAEDFSWRNRRVISRLVGSIADADLLLTDSEATWEDLASRGLDRGVPHRVVYPPLTAFSDLEPPQMELPQEYLLFCGGPDRVKNLETAIAGAGLAGIPLVVAGPGRGGERAPEGVLYAGHLSDRSLGWLYAHASALLLLSLNEGFGYPPLEALSCGTVPIVSDLPVFREVLGPGAIYVHNPRSGEETAEAIKSLLSDRTLRQRVLEEGRRRLSLYSAERFGETMGEVYDSLE